MTTLCIDCQFGEFCFGKDCKCSNGRCDHNPIRRERLLSLSSMRLLKREIERKHGEGN